RFAARVLADAEPDGLAVRELGPPIQQATAHLEGVELTGRAGDVIVMHPHLVHAASANTSDRVRIIGNRGLTLREPMRIDRENPAEHSLVELAIRFALDEREPAAV
ncbi:MAG: phytanoyl-CoA dioxygenase family protein, partial [Phycisphaeraceae bacterium]